MALLLAAGPTHASPALLPSSFSMYCVAWSYAEWLRGRTAASITAGALAVLLGWPFCALLFVPMGLHMLVGAGGHSTFNVLAAGAGASAAILGASVAVDWFMYGKPLLAVVNIILYNALGVGGDGQGSDLYGVEPPEWYLLNCLLNFGLWLPLLLMSPVLVLGRGIVRGAEGGRIVWAMLLVLPAVGWLVFMSGRAHKEERFLFPAYPLMAAAAGASLAEVWSLIEYSLDGCVAVTGQAGEAHGVDAGNNGMKKHDGATSLDGTSGE